MVSRKKIDDRTWNAKAVRDPGADCHPLRRFQSAKSTLAVMEQLNGPDYPATKALREQLEFCEAGARLKQLSQQLVEESEGRLQG